MSPSSSSHLFRPSSSSFRLFHPSSSSSSHLSLPSLSLRVPTFILINVLLLCSSFQVSVSRPPNIVLIVADDLGWGDVSFHGSSQAQTPDIDDLATAGIVLNNYYVSPICTPSRGALLSGRHPINTGLQSYVVQGETPYGLPLQFEILPQYLKRLGYSTHAIGKWHIGHHTKKHMPTSRGFDTFFGYLIGQEDYYDHTSLESIGWGMDLRRNLDGVAEKYFGQYSTTMYTKEAIDVIRQHNESLNGPLFLYLSYQAVHTGNRWSRFQVPKEFEDRFEHIEHEGRRKIVAMGNALNDAVAEVIQSLKNSDLLDNSIIVFTSDNGGATGPTEGPRIDDSFGSNWPLRGTKFALWEGGIRANGFVWSPLLNESSFTYNGLFHATDWLPTLFAAAGGDVRTLPPSLAGLNLWPDLNRGARDGLKSGLENELKDGLKSGLENGFLRREILHNIDDKEGVFAIRSGDYKLKRGTIKGGSFDGWYLPPGEKIVSKHQTEEAQNRENRMERKNRENRMERKNRENRMERNNRENRMERKNREHRMESKIREILSESPQGFKENPDLPIIVKCGEMTNPCEMLKDKLCLFNISEDPCELNNLANKLPSVVKQLLQMVDSYNKTAVKPGNEPIDPKASPELHNYYWAPWIEL